MPNIVAPRPAAGQPITSAWGGEVHDAIERQDIVVGGQSVTPAGGVASVAIVFPSPFLATPMVFLTPNASNAEATVCTVSSNGPNGFTLNVNQQGTTGTTPRTIYWCAIGRLA